MLVILNPNVINSWLAWSNVLFTHPTKIILLGSLYLLFIVAHELFFLKVVLMGLHI